MTCYALWSAEGIASAPGRTAPVYSYLFNHTLQYIEEHTPNLGCEHGSELYLVFDYKAWILTEAETELSQAFVE